MKKPYLKAFGSPENKKYSLHEIRYRSDDGRTLEVENNIEPLDAKKVTALKALFDKRMSSLNPLDKSGVWRYREFLPAFRPFDTVVTMREGNTTIFDMPKSAW
jgi:threonine synthase